MFHYLCQLLPRCFTAALSTLYQKLEGTVTPVDHLPCDVVTTSNYEFAPFIKVSGQVESSVTDVAKTASKLNVLNQKHEETTAQVYKYNMPCDTAAMSNL